MDARGSPKATAVLREIAESTLAFGPNVDPARAYQLDCRRRMSPGEKPADAASLCWSARRLKATFLRVPKLEDVPYPVLIEPNLVVEFYSR